MKSSLHMSYTQSIWLEVSFLFVVLKNKTDTYHLPQAKEQSQIEMRNVGYKVANPLPS